MFSLPHTFVVLATTALLDPLIQRDVAVAICVQGQEAFLPIIASKLHRILLGKEVKHGCAAVLQEPLLARNDSILVLIDDVEGL